MTIVSPAAQTAPITSQDPVALAKARTSAAAMLADDNGQPHHWRVIVTDTESPTGFAPACRASTSDDVHMIADFHGGPIRDEYGVYDCCPWPQVETFSEPFAAYVVALLNADQGPTGGAW
ncbi:hypothetical protein ACFQ7W_00635 [Streptomyces niveus]|uniref:hypothetical protein n=1 Tax=Streptomyces niveus TaxID=193462 RepID=UPI00368302DD